LLNREGAYAASKGPPPQVAFVTETHLAAKDQPKEIEGWNLVAESRDPNCGKQGQGLMGGIAIYVKNNLKWAATKSSAVPENSFSTWIELMTETGVILLGGIYIRPNGATAQQKSLRELKKHLKEAKKDPLLKGILMGGDWNIRHGSFLGDHDTSPFRTRQELASLAKQCDLLLGIPEAGDGGQGGFYTCINKNSQGGMSVVDYYLYSPELAVTDALLRHSEGKGDKSLEFQTQKGTSWVLSEERPADHNRVLVQFRAKLPARPPGYGTCSKEKIEWDEDIVTTYESRMDQSGPLVQTLKDLEDLQKAIDARSRTRIPGDKMESDTKPLRDQAANLTMSFTEIVLNVAEKVTQKRVRTTLTGGTDSEKRQHKGPNPDATTHARHNREDMSTLNSLKLERKKIISRQNEKNKEPVSDRDRQAIKKRIELLEDQIESAQAAVDSANENLMWSKINAVLEDQETENLDEFYVQTAELRRRDQEPLPLRIRRKDDTYASGARQVLDEFKFQLENVAHLKDEKATEFENQKSAEQRRLKTNHDLQLDRDIEQIVSDNWMDEDSDGIEKNIARKEVNEATQSQPADKSTGPDDVTNEMLYYGGELLEKTLTALFNVYYSLGFTPKRIKEAVMIMLYKKGSRENPENYRPIALTCAIMKVYETVLLKRAEKVLAKQGIKLPRLSKEGLNYMQGAGKRKQGTSDVMADLLTMQKQMAKWALLSFDLSKAFDRVSIKGLILKLYKKGIRGRLLQAIWSTYIEAAASIRAGGTSTELTRFPRGVRQGAVLSPLLFVIYVDDLLDTLQSSIPRNLNPAKMYMDDLQILAGSTQDMIKAHEAVYTWCNLWDGVVNESKFAILQHNMLAQTKTYIRQLKLHQFDENKREQIIVKEMTFIGYTIRSDIARTQPERAWKSHTAAKISKMKKKVGELGRHGLTYKKESAPTVLTLLQKILMKILYAGAELWESDAAQYQDLNRAIAKVIKDALGLPRATPTTWVLWEAGIWPAEIEMDMIKLRAWKTWTLKWAKSAHEAPGRTWIKDVTKRAMSRMLPQEDNLGHYLNPKIGPPGREKWNQTIRNAALIRYYDILEEAASKAGGTDHPPYAMIKPDMGTEMESIISRANRLSQAEFSMIHKIRAGAMGLTADTAVRSGASGSDKKLCNRCPLGVADTVQ